MGHTREGMVSRTCSNPQIHATARSMPMPKPEWGTLPNLRRSRIPLEGLFGQIMVVNPLQEKVVAKPCAAIRR